MNKFSPSCFSYRVSKLAALAQALIILGSPSARSTHLRNLSPLSRLGRYFLRKEVVKLTDGEGNGDGLRREMKYASLDPVIEHKRGVAWWMPWRGLKGVGGFISKGLSGLRKSK